MGRVIYPMRLAGFLFLGGGISLILTLSMLYIIVGVVLVVIGYRMTGLSIWNAFKSLRDNGETRGPGNEQDGRKSLPEVAMEPKRFWPGDRDDTRGPGNG